ncbi:MAG: hypothetical protein AAF556_02210 [Pseudomonadota bacterium]
MAYTPIHGTMTLARDQGGTPYSVYDGDQDNSRHNAQEHVTLTFAQGEGGQKVVHQIQRRDKANREAAIALNAAGHGEMASSIMEPKDATVLGVKFEVGGPAEGTVVDQAAFADPAAQTAISQAQENYRTAAWDSIPPIGGQEAQAAALTDIGRYRAADSAAAPAAAATAAPPVVRRP